jgi:hypothetical protein
MATYDELAQYAADLALQAQVDTAVDLFIVEEW